MQHDSFWWAQKSAPSFLCSPVSDQVEALLAQKRQFMAVKHLLKEGATTVYQASSRQFQQTYWHLPFAIR